MSNILPTEYTPWDNNSATRYLENGLWQNKALSTLLDEAAAQHPERIAVIDQNNQRCYRSLRRRALALATGLKNLGLRPGQKVIVQLPNCVEFAETLFALFYLGAVPIMALPAHRRSELEQFAEISQASAYIGITRWDGFDYRPLAENLRTTTSVKHAILLGDDHLETAYEPLFQHIEEIATPRADNLALLQLSGGTTNVPKLIPRTHNDYLYSVVESAKICQLNEHTVYLSVLPTAHNFPLSSPGLLGVISAGGCVVFSPNGAPETAFELIEKHRVTMTAMVPPLALVWLNAAAANRHDISSLKVLQVGGAKFSAEAAKKVSQVLGCQLQQVFGMAEGLVNYTRLNDPEQWVNNTQGRPISAFDEIRIVDEQDNPVAQGEPGLLLTRGPYTIRGYYRATEHNKRAFTDDGFYRTGDVVSMTADGYIVVEGRDKDQINRGGEKIAAEELENHMLAHGDIHDAAVVGMPDEYLGERTYAYLIANDNASKPPKLGQVRKFLIEKGVADYKLPDRVEYVNEFPKTKFGKVNKQALRMRLNEMFANIASI